jgi:hypothetical protein
MECSCLKKKQIGFAQCQLGIKSNDPRNHYLIYFNFLIHNKNLSCFQLSKVFSFAKRIKFCSEHIFFGGVFVPKLKSLSIPFLHFILFRFLRLMPKLEASFLPFTAAAHVKCKIQFFFEKISLFDDQVFKVSNTKKKRLIQHCKVPSCILLF